MCHENIIKSHPTFRLGLFGSAVFAVITSLVLVAISQQPPGSWCQSKDVMPPLSNSKMSPFSYRGTGDGGAYYEESPRGGSAGGDPSGGGAALEPEYGGTTIGTERASDQAPGTTLPGPRYPRSGVTIPRGGDPIIRSQRRNAARFWP